jgi:FkbM family methyltransferase
MQWLLRHLRVRVLQIPNRSEKLPSVQRYARTARIAKRVLPAAGMLLSSARLQSTISLIEMAAAILQGKGSGSGWDIRSEVRAARRFIRPGATVFDVGANKGEWSREIRRELRGTVRLYLFEPQETCGPDLEPLVADGAIWTKAAVGNTDGVACLYSPGDAAGNASLHERRDTFFCEHTFMPHQVLVVSIDSFMERHNIGTIDFMKMDIEGHELFALCGARKALATRAIKAMSFEFGSGNINSRTSFHDYWDLLTGFNYDLYRMLPGGRLLGIRDYTEELEYYRGVSNYVAIASDPPLSHCANVR